MKNKQYKEQNVDIKGLKAQDNAEINVDVNMVDETHIHIFDFISHKTKRVLIIAALVLVIAGIGAVATWQIQNNRQLAQQKQAEYENKFQQGLKLIEQGELGQAKQMLLSADDEAGSIDGHVAIATSLFNTRDYEGFVVFMQSAADKYPELEERADINFCWGVSLMENESNLDAAIEKLEKASEADPLNTSCQVFVALAHLKQMDMASAHTILEQVRQNGDAQGAALLRASIAKAEGRFEDAQSEYESCIQLKGNRDIEFTAYFNLASLYKELRETDVDMPAQEAKILEDMLVLFPNNKEKYVLERLADAYYYMGTQGAEGMLEKSKERLWDLIEAGYASGDKYISIVNVQKRQGDYIGALDTLAKLFEFDKTYASGYIEKAFVIAKIESGKPMEQQNYSQVLECYQLAEQYNASTMELQDLAQLIDELRAGNWLD